MTSKGKVDYQKGLIYAIYSRLDSNLFYIGSTTNLDQRWKNHKKDMKRETKNNLLYQKMNEYGVKNFYIELYEYYPCNSKRELERYEGIIQRKLKPTLNKNVAGQTRQEYREQNKDKILEHNKIYYEQNKDKIKEQHKKYKEQNKDKIKEQRKTYYEQNKDKIKEQRKTYQEQNKDKIRAKNKKYYEQNKDEIREQSKKYYEQNKDQIKEQNKMKIY